MQADRLLCPSVADVDGYEDDHTNTVSVFNPSQERMASVADDADLQEVYDTERHLLYVACTRTRGRLLVTSGDVSSEFLEDMRQ